MKEMLYFMILLYFIFIRKRNREDPDLSEIILWLQKLQLDFISETACLFTNDPQTQKSGKNLILKILKDGIFSGRLDQTSIGEVLDCLLRGQLTCEQNIKIQHIFSLRCLMIMAIALMGRFFFFFAFKERQNFHTLNDIFFLCLSLSISITSLLLIEIYTPKSWFWNKSLTDEGQAWIIACVLGTTPRYGNFVDSFKTVEEKTKYSYWACRSEKNILLKIWIKQKSMEEKNFYQKFSSFSPLIELFGFGSAALLILWTPLNLSPLFNVL